MKAAKSKGGKIGKAMSAYSTGPINQGLKKGADVPKAKIKESRWNEKREKSKGK